MKHPPPEATVVLDSVLYLAYRHRNDGITFSAMPLDGPSCPTGLVSYKFDLDEAAPQAPTASSDASTGFHNVYAMVIMYGGGAIYFCTKKINSIVDSIMRAAKPTACSGPAK